MNNITIPDDLGDWTEETHSAQWAAGTIVELYNVPWDSTYRDVVEFTGNGLDNYLRNKPGMTFTVDRMTQLRPNEPIRLNIPYSRVQRFNYVRVHSPAQRSPEDISFTYYYFLNDARYVAPNTTQLNVQIDVWQTYKDYWTPGIGYVERGHVGMANNKSSIANTTDSQRGLTYLTVPEGLDLGNEYAIHEVRRETIATRTGGDQYGVLVWASTDLAANPGTVENPELNTAKGTLFEGLPNGAGCYYFASASTFVMWLDSVKDKPWVTQGIMSVQAVPQLSRYNFDLEDNPSGGGIPGVSIESGRNGSRVTELYPNWRNNIRSSLPSRYRNLDKFFTHPYCVLELTTNSGAPLTIKPEQWDSNCQIRELAHLAQPSPRIVIIPLYYNTKYGSSSPDGLHDGGEWLDFATGIFDLPTFSVVNNGYMSFMASNKNAIQYQHDTADWSQQRTMFAADSAYDNATRGISDANRHQDVNMNTMQQQTDLANTMGAGRAIAGGAQSLGTGLMFGGAGIAGGVTSALSGAASEGLNHVERNQQLAINRSSSGASHNINQATNAYMRDSNYELAEFAANGDYANAVAGINARVQDAKMTQPTVSGQLGGDAFNLSADRWSVDLKVKFINESAMKIIGEFWLRYGYAVNTFIRPNRLRVMSKFTYWKFKEFNIRTATISEVHKNAIRGIFEKGVTIWENPNDMHVTDNADNNTISGDYYE